VGVERGERKREGVRKERGCVSVVDGGKGLAESVLAVAGVGSVGFLGEVNWNNTKNIREKEV
jgi:hypothetical protein